MSYNLVDWIDVSLDEFEETNTNMNPPDPEAKPARLVTGNQNGKGFWSRRSGLEKTLLVLLGVCGCALVAGSSFYAYDHQSNSNDQPQDPMIKADEVCVTEACAIAAGGILQTMDQSADPCQDFFQFSCGGWVANNEIPDGKSRWGKFYELRDKVDKAVRKIIESPKDETDAESVNYLKDHYLACTDTETIEKLGYEPFRNFVSSDNPEGGWPMIYNSWDSSKFTVENATAGARRILNENLMLSMFVYLDDIDVTQNVIYIDQPDLALPRVMYVEPDQYGEYLEAYRNFMLETAIIMSREFGDNVPEENIRGAVEGAFQLEQALAAFSVPEEDRRNATELYNPFTKEELNARWPFFNWDVYFEAAFTHTGVFVNPAEKIIVREPEYFDGLQQVLQTLPVQAQADYLYWRSVMAFSDEGPKELTDVAFKFSGKLQGTATPLPRWNKCVAKASSDSTGFGMAVGHKYVIANFPETAKEDVSLLVKNLISAFKDLVLESLWMDTETQQKAQEKADAIETLLGYPDWLPDPVELDDYFKGIRPTEATTHFDNMLGVKYWASGKELYSLRDTPERTIWLTQPAIVNAFYSPNHNSITFPAGILQSPFFAFGEGYPRYLNYGAIGVVIGHEITHGFDDQGRQYDGNGNALPWWSPDTVEAFTGQAQCFIDQYNNYTIDEIVDIVGADNAHVNGKNTQGENIADNGGVRESFRAYMKSIEVQGTEQRLPGLTQYTPEQLFFVSFAQVWCERITDQGLASQILTDPHSPGKFRVFGPLSNSEDFVREWNCPAGPMNRPEKCLLW